MENDKLNLINFYDTRDRFVYEHERDPCGNLKLLRECHHEEAFYVCSLFPTDPVNAAEAKKVFLSQGENSIALLYAGIVDGWDGALVRRAAVMGHPYAQGLLTIIAEVYDKFEWAQRAARGGDRSGLWQLGCCFENGTFGVEKNLTSAVAAYKESAELGDGIGMRNYAVLAFEKSDPQRYLWMGRGAQRSRWCFNFHCEIKDHLEDLRKSRSRWCFNFLCEIKEHLEAHREGLAVNGYPLRGSANVLLMIGKMLKGYVDTEKKLVFGKSINVPDYFDAARDTLALYDDCIKRATEAAMTWMLVAKRLGIYRDVARLIGQKVWENKSDFMQS